jgi:parallel beta-helix repeat protein
MKKEDKLKVRIVATVFMALMVTLVFAVLAIGIVSATTWYVEEGESIQAAVDAAKDGDTIIVRDGAYTENVDVNKRLTIRSTSGNPADTIVQAANSSDHVLEVTADYANISGIKVEGSTGAAGIYLYFADNCNISSNNCSNNYHGIYLWYSSGNIITRNTVNSNIYRGIYLWYSSGNIITGNTINANKYYGINLVFSSNNMLTGNTFSEDGLSVYDSYHNTVANNTVNGKPLVYLEEESNQRITDAGQVILVQRFQNNMTIYIGAVSYMILCRSLARSQN